MIWLPLVIVLGLAAFVAIVAELCTRLLARLCRGH